MNKITIDIMGFESRGEISTHLLCVGEICLSNLCEKIIAALITNPLEITELKILDLRYL